MREGVGGKGGERGGGKRSRRREGSCPFFQGFGTTFEIRKMYK